VSTFAARHRLVLGHVKVAEKSNGIVAIPKLLDMVAIEGAIDAMGCHWGIVEEKVNHVLAACRTEFSLWRAVRCLRRASGGRQPVMAA